MGRRGELIEGILHRLGPVRSSTVVQELIGLGLSPLAARQSVSRARGKICRLQKIYLPNRERFLYLAEQFNTDPFWHNLLESLNDTNSCYGRAMHSLIVRGKVPKAHFPCISGAPNHLRKQVPASRILENLGAIDFCATFDGYVHVLPGLVDIDKVVVIGRARYRSEEVLLNAIADWLKRMGFVSFHKVRTRDENSAPEFGHFDWDLVAPSYLSAFVSRSVGQSPKPGFIVADVCLSKELTKEQVGYFVNKCTIIRNMRNMRPFHAFLIADSFRKDALLLGRENGLVFATPDDFFGSGIRAAFRSLLTTLQNATKIAASNPSLLADLLGKLGKIEGAAGNLRGALFELIVAHALKQREGGQIDVGREIQLPSGERVEIDVLHWKPRIETLAVECRGHGPKSMVSKVDVLDWLNRKIPRVREWLLTQNDHQNATMRFEFWTSGSFDEDARRMLQRALSVKKYSIGTKEGVDVEHYISSIKSRRLKDVFQEHYSKHPLALIENGS